MDPGLKKRLLGAVVLIALAVIFVPMLLPGHSGSGSQSVGMKIPPEPSGEMQTRVLRVGPDTASAGSSTQAAINDPDHVATLNLEHGAPAPAQSVPSATAIAATTPPVASTPAPVPVQASAKPGPADKVAKVPPASPAPSVSAKSEPIPGGAGAAAGALYTVNLGIYTDHASAGRLVAQARRHGFSAVATPETYQGKPVLRVSVGPFRSRGDAEAARLKLKGIERVSMTIESGVVDQKGDAPASAIAHGQPGGWAVQLAAFASEGAANQLRDRLRAQGFDGYVDSVDTSSGKLWRVRAGPFASRDLADAARGQIAQKLKIKGNIVTE
ncbi:MAG: SPOR domain-containing protein [Xanthomonadaceae bacterium]|nr:SPOR domain-containing protein [Xanthomonadaceae bacterium]